MKEYGRVVGGYNLVGSAGIATRDGKIKDLTSHLRNATLRVQVKQTLGSRA